MSGLHGRPDSLFEEGAALLPLRSSSNESGRHIAPQWVSPSRKCAVLMPSLPQLLAAAGSEIQENSSCDAVSRYSLFRPFLTPYELS